MVGDRHDRSCVDSSKFGRKAPLTYILVGRKKQTKKHSLDYSLDLLARTTLTYGNEKKGASTTFNTGFSRPESGLKPGKRSRYNIRGETICLYELRGCATPVWFKSSRTSLRTQYAYCCVPSSYCLCAVIPRNTVNDGCTIMFLSTTSASTRR